MGPCPPEATGVCDGLRPSGTVNRVTTFIAAQRSRPFVTGTEATTTAHELPASTPGPTPTLSDRLGQLIQHISSE